MSQMPAPTGLDINHSLQNVSYKMSYTSPNASFDVNDRTKITSEGIYDRETGIVCMVGCQYVRSLVVKEKQIDIGSLDCQILINVQLYSLNRAAGEHHNGTIRSTREKLDPLYFEPLEISLGIVMYRKQAVESIWRMDMEITMVTISLTLQCLIIRLRILCVKKHPDVLPSLSILMLVILSLSHMIPLVLNFEALLFRNHHRQNNLSWTSNGWLMANEFIVRVLTMVALLLQYRLLQVVWSARSVEGKKGLRVAERKALQLCLPLYFVGGLIAWFVHVRYHGTQLQTSVLDFGSTPVHYFWEDLISYPGLILDIFLLPQIMMNIFWNSKDKALAPSFYIGATVIKALPHVYDVYRAHHYVPDSKSSYIYASQNSDFYSSVWNIIIPCEGVVFAVLIYLQQKFSGRFIIPSKFRKAAEYEMVPAVSI